MDDFLEVSGWLTGAGIGEIPKILTSLLLTIILSLILVFTYDKTTSPINRSPSFIQALLLMSLVTAIIMQSIGDSLALSFGIFGALAIIRFRSNVSDLRDIAFLFATMAIGIACGVHSFTNAVIGTLLFCVLIMLLKISPFDAGFSVRGGIRIELPDNPEIRASVESGMKPLLAHLTLSRFRVIVLPDGQKSNEYEYSFVANSPDAGSKVKEQLEKLEGVRVTRISFEDGTNAAGNN